MSDGGLPTTTVVGLGNVLMADDAFGPYFVNWLEAHYELPEELECVDLGTPGLDLYPHLVHREIVILADTVRSNGAPGELRIYRLPEILQSLPKDRVSPHDPGLKETLLSLEFAGHMPKEVLLVGVIPVATDNTVGLSPPVQDALAPAGAAVVAELGRLGFRVKKRSVPVTLDLWWERNGAS